LLRKTFCKTTFIEDIPSKPNLNLYHKQYTYFDNPDESLIRPR
jgi:hypothetical protein